MKELYELQDKACEFIKMLNEKGKMGAADWEIANHVTGTMKNIDKILMRRQGNQSHMVASYAGNSQAGHWHAEGQYGSGNSYNNGYSGDPYSNMNHSRNNHPMNSYSQGNGRVVDQLQEMMQQANEKEKEVLRRCMSELKSF